MPESGKYSSAALPLTTIEMFLAGGMRTRAVAVFRLPTASVYLAVLIIFFNPRSLNFSFERYETCCAEAFCKSRGAKVRHTLFVPRAHQIALFSVLQDIPNTSRMSF